MSQAKNRYQAERWLLDKYYIPTRYPNGLPDLTPGQVYREEDARRGLDAARFLAARCREWLAGR